MATLPKPQPSSAPLADQDSVERLQQARIRAYRGQIESQANSATANPATQDDGSSESELLATHEIEVIATKGGKEIARAMAKVQILPDTREFLQPRSQPENLRRLAKSAGGSVLGSSSELAALLQQMPAIPGDAVVTRQPIWDSPLLRLLIVGLLGVEWSLRRLAGYG